MKVRIPRWLLPPIFPDEEQTRIASVLHLLLIAAVVITVVDVVVLLVFAPNMLSSFWLNGAVVLVAGILLWLLRRGQVYLVGGAFCLTLGGVSIYYAAISGGLTSSAFDLIAAVIFIAALVFGSRGAVLAGLLSIATAGSLYLATQSGWLVAQEGPPSLARQFVTYSTILAFLVALMVIWDRSIRQAIARAQKSERSLTERNEELQRQITERQQVETALRESEEKYRHIIEAMPLGMHLYQLEEDGRLVFIGANPAADRILNVDHRQFIGKTIEEAFPPLIETEIPQHYRLAAAHNITWRKEQSDYQDDQIRGAFEVHAFQTSPGKMVATFQDITGRKRTEVALRDSEQRFRSVVEEAYEGVALTNEQGRVIVWNRALEQITDIPAKDVLNKPVWDVQFQMAPTDQQTPQLYEYYKTAVVALGQTGQLPWADRLVEREYVHADGSRTFIESRASVIKTDSGYMIVNVVQDITPRRQAEDALRQKTEELDRFFNVALDLLCIADTDGHFRRVNASWERILGHSSDELITMRFLDFVHPDDMPGTLEAMSQLASQQEVINFVNRYRCKDGTYRWIEWRSAPAGGLIYAAARDITERKQAEDALRLSEERYRVVSDMISDYAFSVRVESDTKMSLEWITQSTVHMTGYTPQELMRQEAQHPYALYYPDDRALVDADMQRLMQGETTDTEYRIVDKTGGVHWVRLCRYPVWDETQQRVIRYYGVAQDITARKRAEQEILRRDTILETVSTVSKQLLNAPDWETENNYILGLLGAAAAADRILINLIFQDTNGTLRANLQHEWDAPGISSQRYNPLLYNVDLFEMGYGPIVERLAQKQGVLYHRREHPPEKRLLFDSTGILSCLYLPVFLQGKLWGSLQFATTRQEHKWSKPEIEALQIAADMLGAVIERKQAENALQQYIRRLSILHQIDRAMLAAASSTEIAAAAMQHIRQLIPCQYAMIGLFDLMINERVLLAADTDGESVASPGDRRPLDGLSMEVFKQGQAFVIGDLRASPDMLPGSQYLLDRHLYSLAAVPLIMHGKILGSLDLVASALQFFTEEYVEIAREIADQLAIAIHQARLWENERDQRTLAEALRDSAAAVSSTLKFDEVLDRLLTNVERVVPYDAANVMLLKDGVARVVRSRGWAERGLGNWIAQVRFTVDNIPDWRQFLLGQHPRPYTIMDTQTDPGWINFPEEQWIRSTAKAPILVGGQLIGILHLDSATPNFFTQEHLDRLQVFAHQAAVAIHNAQLFEAEQRRRHIAETLAQTATVLSSTLKLKHVLDLILVQLYYVIHYDSASIQQLEDHELAIIACQGFEKPQDVLQIKLPLDPQIPNYWVITEKMPMAFEQVAQLYPQFHKQAEGLGFERVNTWLGLPLLSKDTVIGMITLDRFEVQPFSAEDIELAMAFAHQAALAIENARLYEQAERHTAELEQHVRERTIQLEAANEELRVLSRMKDEFVSNVSHELRTPITNLNLRFYMLEKQPGNLTTHLPVIQRETGRLSRIIDDLLMLSRMDQNRTTFKLTAVDLTVLVRQFAADRVPLAESRGLTLHTNVIPGTLMVEADAGLLEQALSVLLTNALNYTSSGGHVTVCTRTSQFEDQQWAGFSVSDTGPGIKKEEQARLFTRFFRGEASRASGVSGTGLGLAIAKEIVDRHHGRITVESEGIPGKGTTFRVWLPTMEEPG